MTAKADFCNPAIKNTSLNAQQMNELLELQNIMLEAAIGSDDIKALLDKLCMQAEALVPGTIATIMLLRRGVGKMYVHNAPSAPVAARQLLDGLKVGEGACGNVVYHNQEMYVANTTQDARFNNLDQIVEDLNLLACWSMPIRDNQKQPFGSFSLSSFKSRAPDFFQTQILKTCSNIVSILLQKQELQSQSRQWEKEADRVEKIRSLEIVSGGIAHDFNNLIGIISGNLEMLEQAKAVAGDCRHFLENCQTASRRMAGLTQQLMNFSQSQSSEPAPCDLRQVLRECSALVFRGSPVRIDWIDACSDTPMTIVADREQISRVFQNVLLNARQCLQENGCVTLTLKPDVEHTRFGDNLASRFHRVDIQDSGPGIDVAVIDSIFDPFFTTQPEGTGLGLAISHAIMRKHQGDIRVTSEPGRGSVFSLLFSPSHQQPVRQAASHPLTGRRSGFVIVMDDEPLLREMTARMLEAMGFEVSTTSDGDAAVQAYLAARNSGKKVDLVITDLTVPGGKGGKYVADNILSYDPDANIVLYSGYLNDPTLSSYTAHGFKDVLTKPFTLQDLHATIDKVLTTV